MNIKTINLITEHAAKMTLAAVIKDPGTAIDALGDAVSHMSQRALRPVHRSVYNYINTSDQDMKMHVTRIFQRDLGRKLIKSTRGIHKTEQIRFNIEQEDLIWRAMI